jgi:DNA-binding transcriptional regulator YiaG
MSKILDSYTFKGFGFDVILKNIAVKSVDGEEYPAVNLNELKNTTAKALLTSKQRLTGYQIKFLRTYLKMSYDEVAAEIHVAASTLRSWENKGADFTGLDVGHEKAFRIMAISKILEKEKSKFNIEVTLVKEFQSPAKMKALDITSSADSFVSNG